MAKHVASAEEIFAAKILILAILSVILAVGGALLAQRFHQWIRRDGLKHAIFGGLLFVILAILLYPAEELLKQPEIAANFFLPIAVIVTVVYEREKTEWVKREWSLVLWFLGHELCHLSKSELILPLICAAFLAGGWASGYFLRYSFREQGVFFLLGLIIAMAILTLGIWQMSRKDEKEKS